MNTYKAKFYISEDGSTTAEFIIGLYADTDTELAAERAAEALAERLNATFAYFCT